MQKAKLKGGYASKEEINAFHNKLEQILEQKELNAGKKIRTASAAKPITRKTPEAPLRTKKSGYCNIFFDITETGETENIEAVYCTMPSLKQRSLDAVSAWTYSPKTLNDEPVTSKANSKINFEIPDGCDKPIPAWW